MVVTFTRSRCYAGPVSAPVRRRFHHPDFNARETSGWKALEAEGRLAGGAGGGSSNGRWRWGCPAPKA